MSITSDETTQGCHPFTVGWWSRLPAAYRAADRVQGYRLTDAWRGLNRDPRFITGWDGWHRTNTSDTAWESSVAFTRTFRVAPHVPLYVRSWHSPVVVTSTGDRIPALSDTKVRHVIRNYTGQVIADDAPVGSGGSSTGTTILDGGGPYVGDEDVYDGGTTTDAPTLTTTTTETTTGSTDQIVHVSRVLPDRFGVAQVTVHVAVNVPDARDHLAAIHVGTDDVTFAELPGYDYFTTAAAYPLLRFMDGVGHQAGYLSDMVNEMHDGTWSNPVTAPESRLMFLSAMLGVPYRYASRLTMGELREHLVDLIEGNSPTPGSRDHIAITAKQWLTGNKDVSVMPAHAQSTADPAGARAALITAAGYDDGTPTEVHVQENAPLDGLEAIRWTGAVSDSTSEWTLNGALRYENLLRNPDFGFTVNHWTVTGAATMSHDPDGAAALSLTGDATLLAPPESYVPIDGGSYTLRFWVYPTTADVLATATMTAATDNPNITRVVSSTEIALTANAWQLVEVSGALDDAVTIAPSLSLKAAAAVTVWVDDTQLSRVEYTAPYYFDGNSPDPVPPFSHDIWVTPRGVAYLWEGQWVEKPLLDAEADVVALGGITRETLHTLIVTARADEVPQNDLQAFADFLNAAGVIPAGHRVVVREAIPDWASWEAISGPTWDTQADVIKTWNDSDSAGVNLSGEGA